MTEDKKIKLENEDGDSADINADLSNADNINLDGEKKDVAPDLGLVTENEKLKADLAAKNDRLLRLQADFDNFRKRTAKEKLELASTVEQAFLKDLLPLLDNLSRAAEAAEGDSAESEKFRQGIKMIRLETIAAMGKHGLEPIETEGKMFDPNFHQAVGTVKDESKEDGMIAAEFQSGYMARGRVIRPSMVQVVNNA
ncbi:MAG: nucleotide exchange factor GrpE [Selenomonadaceae bacterium]|nr:nucleotide exchange factor GrpE [Selenomonadaceae bacterium]